MTDPSLPEAARTPPSTGHPEVDAALAGITDLDDAPLPEHHDRLAGVHEALHRVLSKRPSHEHG